MKRIFAAIDISERTRRAASDYIESLRGDFPAARAAWTKPEKLHLTLKFFGETSDEQLTKLTEAIEATGKSVAPFNAQIGGAGVFPAAQKPRVLWLGAAAENDNLRKLSERLEDECARRGFPKENRNFKAHLTIARIREPQIARELTKKHLLNQFETVAFCVDEIVIYESRLLPRGSIYAVVSKHGFKMVNSK